MKGVERSPITAADDEPYPGEEGRGSSRVSDDSARPLYATRMGMVMYAGAALSLLAATIHLWAMPEHFEEWWGYGTFFLVSAAAQGAYGIALLRWPSRPILLLGVGGNLSIVALYLVTRTVGIPLLGPRAGEVEGLGALGLSATAAELALVSMLGAVLLRGLPRERAVVLLFVLALAGLLVGHLLHLVLSLAPAHHP